jgi:hypothetical protein
MAELALRPSPLGGYLSDRIHCLSPRSGKSHAMADHQIGERLSINQHDALRDSRDKVIGAAREIRRCDKDAFARPMALETTYEIAHFG